MAVRLEGTIRRYIGLASDLKPTPYGDMLPEGDTLPAGSSFLESDTGRIFRWDGAVWAAAPAADDTAAYLAAILMELRQLREALTLAFA